MYAAFWYQSLQAYPSAVGVAMALRGIPEAVLEASHPLLAGWLRHLGLHLSAGLSNFFTEAELQNGSTALELWQELGGSEDSEFPKFASDLDGLVRFAQVQADQRNRGFAALPAYVFHFERRVRARQETHQAAELRLQRHELQLERANVPPLPLRLRQGHRVRRGDGHPVGLQGRQEQEEEQQRRWIGKLHGVLVELEAPVLNVISSSSRPGELLASHLGGRRAATLAARARAWARYRGWLRAAYGIGHHGAAHHLLDYLLDRRAEPATKGTLSAIFAMMRFADQAMGIPLEARWSSDANVVSMVNSIIAGAAASVGGRSRGPAPAPTAGLLGKLEELVCNDGGCAEGRRLAWWFLVSSWASLRYDDHRGMSPSAVEEAPDGLDFILDRTKTTGEDKPVRTRRCVVSARAWIREPRWLLVGWRLWKEHAPRQRDYFLTQTRPDGTAIYRSLAYVEYAGLSRGIIADLLDDDGIALGTDLAPYWRPHSWRCFVPSMATALGAPADDVRWLSAWKAQSAEAYVRTSRTKTLHIQNNVAQLLRLHSGGADPVGERWALEQVSKHIAARGGTEGEINRVVKALVVFPGEAVTTPLWPSLAAPESSGGQQAAVTTSREPAQKGGPRAVDGGLGSSSESDRERAPASGYVIVTSRKGRRCLHKVGLCYRRAGVHYHRYEAAGADRPSMERYDDYCRDCWRQGPPRGTGTSAACLGSDTGSSRRTSSSGSGSSTTESGDER